MKNALLLILLISFTVQQGYNQGYSAQGNFGNNQQNINTQSNPNQYGNMGQNVNTPQINSNEQNQQNVNVPQDQINQQNQNEQPQLNNQYGNQQNVNANQYGNQQGQNENQYGNQQNVNANPYGNQQNNNENKYINQQGQNENQYRNSPYNKNEINNNYQNQDGNKSQFDNSQSGNGDRNQYNQYENNQQSNPQNQYQQEHINQQEKENQGNINQQNQEKTDITNKEESGKNFNYNNQIQGNQIEQQYPKNQQYQQNQPEQNSPNQQYPQNIQNQQNPQNQQDGQQNQYQQNQQYQQDLQQNQQNQPNQFSQNQQNGQQNQYQQNQQYQQGNQQNQQSQPNQYAQNQQNQQYQQNQYQQNQNLQNQYQQNQNMQNQYQQNQQYPQYPQNMQNQYNQNQQFPQGQQYPQNQYPQNQQFPQGQQNQQYPYQRNQEYQNQQNQQYQNQQNHFYQNGQQQRNQINNYAQNQQNNQVINNVNDLPFPQDFISIFDPRKVNLSRHYEDCDDIDVFCIKSLTCKFNRCLTSYEVKRTTLLNLKDKNMCEDDDDCPAEKQCVKHRCVDDENDAQYNKRNINNKDPSVNLLFAGSIFLSNTSYDSGVYPDGSFNYDHLFKYIKNDIRKADLAIVDQETMFETDKMNFIKKLTNTPSELGDAIYRAGFKVVLHATLYSYSKEERGIKNTLNFWKQKYPDVKVLGINEKEGDNENDYFIFQKNSMKIGLINFYGHDEEMIPEDKHYYINILKEEKLKDLVEKLANETDFLIVTINWGDKNSNKPNKQMISCATEFAYFGVNLIIGYHPSITLPTSYIKASNGKIALVFWSLGHLVIDFKKEFSNLGAMANITISKSRNGAYISAYNLIPTINHKVRGNQYSVYKLSQYSDSLFKQSFSYYNFTREEVVERCEEMMGGLADCY